MTVGETLTEARYQAGLSVDELSERTRIRSTVIRSIEQDDYAACGGELYVRGYVRAIAGAVGIDALPLIREFDQAHGDDAAGRQAGPPATGVPGWPDPDATRFDLPPVALDPDATRFDLPPVPADPDATRFDLPLIPGLPPAPAPFDEVAPTAVLPAVTLTPATGPSATGPSAARPPAAQPPRSDDLMAAGYQLPAPSAPSWPAQPWPAKQWPAQPQPAPPWPSAATPAYVPPSGARPFPGSPAQGPGRRDRRRTVAALAGAALAAVALVVAAIHLAGGGTTSKGTAGAAVSPSATAAGGARASAAAEASAAARASAAAKASAAKASKATAAKTAASRAVLLPVAAARAFGPDGFADGDNPGSAGYTIARNPQGLWSTQWYATANFGMLKHGTGLLLDLGRTMTITGIRFTLTSYQGADLQIRVGNGTAPQGLRVAATATNTGGLVRLALPHPEVARYLVIWFTLLAPDGAGHYQESVSHVAIAGHR